MKSPDIRKAEYSNLTAEQETVVLFPYDAKQHE